VRSFNLRRADDPLQGQADLAAIHPSLVDPVARLQAMDLDGVHTQVLLPSFIGFAGERLRFLDDAAAWTECAVRYNDFLLDEFCAVDRERLVGVGIVPLHGVDAAIAELHRLAGRGVRAVSFPHDPRACGLPGWHGGHWHPLLRAAEEAGLVLMVHVGTPPQDVPITHTESPGALLVRSNLDVINAAIDMLYSRSLLDHPELQVVFLEAGIGWVPYLAERIRFFHRRRGIWPAGARHPLEVWRAQVHVSFISDTWGIQHLDAVGADRVLWSSDFPHFDSYWPASRPVLERECATLPSDQAELVVGGTARRLLRL